MSLSFCLRFANTGAILFGIVLSGGEATPLNAQTAGTNVGHPTVQHANPAISEPAAAAQLKKDEARLLAILSGDPENAGALAGMGWVRSRQRNYPGAVSFLERARQYRPNDHALAVALDLARFKVMLAEAGHSLESGDLDSARRYYNLALEIQPHNAEASAGLLDTLRRDRDLHPANGH
jgi:tetratricopeptide (TPR) repeat protein